jgi:hypothetical protein
MVMGESGNHRSEASIHFPVGGRTNPSHVAGCCALFVFCRKIIDRREKDVTLYENLQHDPCFGSAV